MKKAQKKKKKKNSPQPLMSFLLSRVVVSSTKHTKLGKIYTFLNAYITKLPFHSVLNSFHCSNSSSIGRSVCSHNCLVHLLVHRPDLNRILRRLSSSLFGFHKLIQHKNPQLKSKPCEQTSLWWLVTWTAPRTKSVRGGRGCLRWPASHSPHRLSTFRKVYIPKPCFWPSCHDPS